MIRKLMKIWIGIFCLLASHDSFSQLQTCPVNINFSSGYLTHWEAYTGNNKNGNGPSAIQIVYDSLSSPSSGTNGASAIPEYTLPSVTGIQVLTNVGSDFFGGFPTVPTINGYQYGYSIKLGSTSISPRSSNSGPSGGYIRGVSYKINVPAGPSSEPYTMTYTYAMVLENGAHNSDQQPLFSASLKTNDSIITCASPAYYLPASGANGQGGGALLDSAAAIANGFKVSSQLSPHPNPNSNDPNAPHLQDVWYKGWTEVTFDLSPYRGQQVTLTFEADNCVPGGHFAYAYVALRNTCAGLEISGDSIACINGNSIYSVPALAGATYEWTVPSDWVVTSGSNTNIINVKVGQQIGSITVRELNSCADLKDTIAVTTRTPTIPGNATADATVCEGINSTPLTLSGNNGNILGWISSTDGLIWNSTSGQSQSYTAQNLSTTTFFKAVVQNGSSCAIDSSNAVTITVDPKSVGGSLDPSSMNYCAGQDINSVLILNGKVGDVVDWQISQDSTTWAFLSPLKTDTSYNVTSIASTTYYRVIVKDGVCPQDTSAVASIKFYNTPFPQAQISPADTTICYGASAPLNALVTIGTNYSWINNDSLSSGGGNGNISSIPSLVSAVAAPSVTADYVLNIQNTGCPNTLSDTFHIHVIPPIIVSGVHDTSVVINEPLQFNATSSDSVEDIFLWSPASYLNNPNIAGPIGIYNSGVDSITYIVRATDYAGCYGEAKVKVKIFKTPPDIFVPNAFTPGATTNNIFRPIPVGIAKFQYFKVYNRWGQLVYATSQTGVGWNGIFNGKPQDIGTYVWMAQGIDYLGKTIARKGTMVLIR